MPGVLLEAKHVDSFADKCGDFILNIAKVRVLWQFHFTDASKEASEISGRLSWVGHVTFVKLDLAQSAVGTHVRLCVRIEQVADGIVIFAQSLMLSVRVGGQVEDVGLGP